MGFKKKHHAAYYLIMSLGDAALKRRYLEQSRKKEELKVEVKVLEKFGEKDKADLADLQREARINDGRLMCMKVGCERILDSNLTNCILRSFGHRNACFTSSRANSIADVICFSTHMLY